MIRKVLPVKNFSHRLFAIVAIVALVAFLLTIKPVAEVVKKLVEMLGITFPPMDIFTNTAANIGYFAAGGLLLWTTGLILIPVIKVAVTIVAVAIIGVAVYNLIRTFSGKPTQKILPDLPSFDKK